MDNFITIKGAREHNLKNISLSIPKNKLVVFTGISGSGKSSLAFDTLFAEGQRRYVESLSSYARQFLGNSTHPDVDLIEGLSPAIAINQKAVSHNPRSTVGTITEIYDYLRLLFARIGLPHCPDCGRLVLPQTNNQIVDQILSTATTQIKSLKPYRLFILAPLVDNRRGDFRGLLKNLRSQGFKWARIDNQLVDLYGDFAPAKTNKHKIEAVIDRLSLTTDSLKQLKATTDRLKDSVDQTLKISNGLLIVSQVNDSSFDFPDHPQQMSDTLYSQNFACPVCNISLPALEPHLFSFNSPQGACPECNGLGFKFKINRSKFPEWKAKIMEHRYFTTDSDTLRSELKRFLTKTACPVCQASRLNPQSLSVTVDGKNIYHISQMPINELSVWISTLDHRLDIESQREILLPIQKELASRIEFLLAVGLGYLSIEREAGSLSSGESQRIRLASQIGTGLTGVLYILDEPTIGLHPRDNARLIKTLKRLRDLGNTVIVVEHDQSLISSADYIVDFGPKAGKFGGQIVVAGTLKQIKANNTSLTAKYLKKNVSLPKSFVSTPANHPHLIISGCSQWNLKNITAKIPLNRLVCVTGVSGSGKSTLVHDTLYAAVKDKIFGSYHEFIGKYKKIDGWQQLLDLQLVDQSPIGRTPRSNPTTYTKVFDDIRKLMAQTIEAQVRGYHAGHFSFNVKGGGRCQACQGQGQTKIEMQFMPDIYITCEECHGSRFQEDVLEVEYKDKNIADILSLTIDEALSFFANIPSLKRKLTTICQVGLGYLELGQPSNTLSGGESQRLKISRELVKNSSGRTLYVLDEPTTGLHPYDIDKLLKVLRQLVDQGNTVLLIEHNPDVIRRADWIIDLGPEGGDKGGHIVAQGPLSKIMATPASYTGQFLKNGT